MSPVKTSGFKRTLFKPATSAKRAKSRPAKFQKAAAALTRSLRATEIKTVDVNATTTVPSTTDTINLLNGLVEGVDGNNRVGRRVNMKSLKVRMFWGNVTGAAAVIAPYVIRWAIVYDRQPNAANPAWADVFSNINVAGTNDGGVVTSFPNPTNFDRFVILRDGFRNYDPINTTPSNQLQESGNRQDSVESHFVPLKGLESHFIAGAGAGTIADFRTGALLFMTKSNVAAANAQFNVTWTARLRYHDA